MHGFTSWRYTSMYIIGEKIFDEVKLTLDVSEGKYEPFNVDNVGNERSPAANYTVVRKWPDSGEMVRTSLFTFGL